MAFLLRSISRSAEGREIVRTSRVEDALLRVGRDPSCDIVLNDLAVALHHATIEAVEDGQLGISAEMGMTIEIDGSATGFGRINLHSGGDIGVGPFLLRVVPTPHGVEDVSIEIAEGELVVRRMIAGGFAVESVLVATRRLGEMHELAA